MLGLVKTLLRVRWRGLLRLRPANHTLRLECVGEGCGRCCNVMGGGVVVTPDEANRIGPRFVAIQRGASTLRANGLRCCLLTEGNCRAYDARPRGCREYPWYNLDGRLYYDSGCPGIRSDRDERPNVSAISPVAVYLPALPISLRRAAIAIMRVW